MILFAVGAADWARAGIVGAFSPAPNTNLGSGAELSGVIEAMASAALAGSVDERGDLLD